MHSDNQDAIFGLVGSTAQLRHPFCDFIPTSLLPAVCPHQTLFRPSEKHACLPATPLRKSDSTLVVAKRMLKPGFAQKMAEGGDPYPFATRQGRAMQCRVLGVAEFLPFCPIAGHKRGLSLCAHVDPVQRRCCEPSTHRPRRTSPGPLLSHGRAEEQFSRSCSVAIPAPSSCASHRTMARVLHTSGMG